MQGQANEEMTGVAAGTCSSGWAVEQKQPMPAVAAVGTEAPVAVAVVAKAAVAGRSAEQ